MKSMLIFIFIILNLNIFAQRSEVLDLEVHPQASFPSISISYNGKNLDYFHNIILDDVGPEGNLSFKKKGSLEPGSFKLSGYIFAKEFFEAKKFPKSLSNKKKQAEFLKILNENDPVKVLSFLLDVNERKRSAKNEAELKKAQNLIGKDSDESAEELSIFSTGFVELKPMDQKSQRTYVRFSDIDKSKIKFSADQMKVEIVKSLAVYGLETLSNSINFGDIKVGDEADLLAKNLTSITYGLCHVQCIDKSFDQASGLAHNILTLSLFNPHGAKGIDLEEGNNYVLGQMYCLLKEFNNNCKDSKLKNEILKMSENPIFLPLKKRSMGQDFCEELKKLSKQ